MAVAPWIARAEDTGDEPPALNIGSHRELFVDDFLVEQLTDGARLQLHHPTPREIALVHDAPWEGTGSGYHSVFRDDDRYRMYYKAWHLDAQQGKLDTGRHPLYCCYAESDDGIHWRKPELGLYEIEGSKQNNVVMVSGKQGPLNVDAGHPAVFKDDNPDASSDARYKAIFRSSGTSVDCSPFKSPDGLHWSPMSSEPILGGLGAFDSQNLAFWDPTLGKYRGYWRFFTDGVRAIRTATSDDLVHWSEPHDLTYVDSPVEQLYTNQVKPYYRAPHILIGFPTRYVDRGWSDSMKALPELEHRQLRASSTERLRHGDDRRPADGRTRRREVQALERSVLAPGPERPGTWNYGQQYIAWQVVETASDLEGAPNELSLYAARKLLDRQGECPAALHAAARRLRLGQRSAERRRAC